MHSVTYFSQRIDSILHVPSLTSFFCITCDQNIIVVDQHTLAVKRQFIGFNDEIYSVCLVSSDGSDKHLVVGTNSSELRLYNMADWSCQLVPGHTDCVLAVDSPKWNRHIFASSSKDSNVILWTLSDLKIKSECTDDVGRINQPIVTKQVAIGTGHTSGVSDVKFCHSEKNSSFFLSVSSDSTLKLWAMNNVLENQQDDVTVP